MIKSYLWPLFKKFIGLFLSMVLVSMFSITLLSAFGSAVSNLDASYREYKRTLGSADVSIKTSFVNRLDLSGLGTVEGVDSYGFRLTLDSYFRFEKPDGAERTVTSRIFSFSDPENDLLKHYVYDSVAPREDMINVALAKRFVDNNGFKLGQVVEFGYFNMFVHAQISQVVDAPETLYVRANDAIWSDNTDFGFVYVSEAELGRGLSLLAGAVKDAILGNPEFAAFYEKVRQIAGIDFPDLRDEIDWSHFPASFSNQISVMAKEGYSNEEVYNNVSAYLAPIVSEKSHTLEEKTPYEYYMNNVFKQLRVGTIFLPAFFYLVTMVIIVLFMNQIIKSMTQQIGIMMGIGIQAREIFGLFAIYVFFMSVAAGIFGIFAGWGVTYFLTGIFIEVYSMPLMLRSLHWLWSLIAVLSLVVVGQVASVLSCLNVLRITPKDAMISNESARKANPKWVERLIDKSPMTLKLGINSIAQNPKRFFVSTFSIFSAFMMIVIVLFFHISMNELIQQTAETRMPFDCQVYMTQKVEESSLSELKGQPFVEELQYSYFSYLELKGPKDTRMLETVAVKPDDCPLTYIPAMDGDKPLSVEEQGIILPNSEAKRLGVKVGDSVAIGTNSVVVTAVSRQYSHLICYVSLSQMEEVADQYLTSLFLDVSDEDQALNYLANNENQCLTVFSSSLKKDLRSRFGSVDIIIYVLIGFSLLMGFTILTIMSQNALMDQKRQVSIMRSVGFRIIEVSNLWTLQSASQLLISTLFAVPIGALFAYWLFDLATIPTQIYPFVFDWPSILFAFAFIFVVIFLSHVVSMVTINRWNLADNTRSRE